MQDEEIFDSAFEEGHSFNSQESGPLDKQHARRPLRSESNTQPEIKTIPGFHSLFVLYFITEKKTQIKFSLFEMFTFTRLY